MAWRRRGVNSLENFKDVADIMLTTYAESITYGRKCKEFWMESATSPVFYAKRMIMKGINRRQAGIWRKNRRQIGDTNFESGGSGAERQPKTRAQNAMRKR